MVDITILTIAIFEGIIALLFFLPWAIIFQVHFDELGLTSCDRNNTIWLYCMLVFYWSSSVWSLVSIPLRYQASRVITDENMAVFSDGLLYVLYGQFILLIGLTTWLGILLKIDQNGCEPFSFLLQIYFIINLVFIGIVVVCCTSMRICCSNIEKQFGNNNTNNRSNDKSNSKSSPSSNNRQRSKSHTFEPIIDETHPLVKNNNIPYLGSDETTQLDGPYYSASGNNINHYYA